MFAFAIVLWSGAAQAARNPQAFKLEEDIAGAHDPSMIRAGGTYYVFTTGRTPGGGQMAIRCSNDLTHWRLCGQVFDSIPAWIQQRSPGTKELWAPDISYAAGKYRLYYAYSLFGKNTSGIGLASNPTLDPNDPAYHWTDEGLVIKSGTNDDFNALDPAIFHDADDSLWLAFGSFWSGIRMIQLDRDSGQRITPDFPVFSLAHYDSIEASYIYQDGGYYYLFVDWGMCCRGANSTYNIRLGRSRKVTGPYLDKDGVNMLYGGGSLFLDSTGPLIGPGHAGIIVDKGTNWFSCHFESGGAGRRGSVLAIIPLRWNADGWPEFDLRQSGQAAKLE